jgi:hydroxymethylpyrimidine pyrophosphatase-like HAD family hydrolase
MGNAIDALKQQADYITTSVDEDGILNALRHFRVI